MHLNDIFPIREAAARLPTRTFRELWHVGTMDPQHKRAGSHEGAGLSVSLHPGEWRRIARGHVGGDLWRCTKPGNRFLDFHKLTKTQRRMIEDWGVAHGFATRGSLWRVTLHDENDEPFHLDFPTREQAEREAWEAEDVAEVPGGGLLPTPLFHQRTRTTGDTVDLGLLATLFVEDATDLDGVWWNDLLDVARLSAPRGVIVPGKVAGWTNTRQEAVTESEADNAGDIHRAYNLISEYVTHGQMRADDQFDGVFDELWHLLPRPGDRYTLFRVLGLPREQVERLKSGQRVALRPRAFSSWTKSERALGRLIAGRRGGGLVPVVVRKAVPGSAVVIDVERFYRENHFTEGYDEWARYVAWEQEVIVRHDGAFGIGPEDVVRIVEDSPPVEAPEPGDVIINTSGWEEEIEDVPAQQPRAAEGVFQVLVNGGERVWVRDVGDGEWEELP